MSCTKCLLLSQHDRNSFVSKYPGMHVRCLSVFVFNWSVSAGACGIDSVLVGNDLHAHHNARGKLCINVSETLNPKP